MRCKVLYITVRVGGSDDSPLFRATVHLLPNGLCAGGEGRGKIASRSAAAAAMLEKFNNPNCSGPHGSALDGSARHV